MNEVVATNITFRKIKVKPGVVHLEFTESKTIKGNDGQEWIESTDYVVDRRLDPVREFHDAMQALASHLVVICEFFDDIEELPLAFMSAIEVTGISIGGSDEYAGVTITGHRKLKSGKVFNMNSPFTRFVDEENPDAYPHSFEMASAVSKIEQCAREYLGGKHAANMQLELFSTEHIDDAGILDAKQQGHPYLRMAD